MQETPKYLRRRKHTPKHHTEAELIEEMFDRLSLHTERSVDEQIQSLSEEHLKAFNALKEKWERKPRKMAYEDEMYLRFLRASPGDTKFNVKTAFKVMKNYSSWCLDINLHTLSIKDVHTQLKKDVLILPGAKTKSGYSYLYMKPGLYFPSTDSLPDLLRSLVYLLECMTEEEKSATEGVAFMADMANWGWNNFSVGYAKSFFDTMQGRFPCRVRLFLIVNPPSWFGAVWRLIRPMMTKEFAKKVEMPSTTELQNFVDKEDTPKELGGNLDLQAASEAFIKYRYKVEGHDMK